MTKTEFLEKWINVLKLDTVRTAQDFGADVDAVFLQYREAAKMASILLGYIHDLKRHEGSIENCGQEPCPATLEFLSKRTCER